jgi:hypothetical protein
MSDMISPIDPLATLDANEWAQHLPDGAVSVEAEGSALVLRASHQLQEQFDTLLDKQKAGALSPEETRAYEAICDLDTVLSWLNRLMRGAQSR